MLDKLSSNGKDLFLVIGTILILLILFSPIPPFLLDFAIIVNFGLGLTILLLTFYVAKPVEFSTFPSLLLVATLYRLSLNVAATRLILTGGDAGEVIGAIGDYAVQGNFVIGLVVFFILVVVQYVVITSGAQRVSEVAARFTLDSMPGQQMSIDADLNMGLIDQHEAAARRKELEKEASFYGSMDGASKFVKGDAIAGIIILLIDIIAGWIVGVVQMGMTWLDALQHFTLLTIGDGIATQLPALIISVATGIIVTRSSADRELSTEVLKQLASVPRIPLIVTCSLLILLLLPGMPKWPIFIIVAFALFVWISLKNRPPVPGDDKFATDEADEESHASSMPAPIEVTLGGELAEKWKPKEPVIFERIASLRKSRLQANGYRFPAVKFRDDTALGTNQYNIAIFGTSHGKADIFPEMTLAVRSDISRHRLSGIETTDPAFGLPAIWIENEHSEHAKSEGYTLIDPLTVFVTHLSEVIKSGTEYLFTRNDIVQMLDGVRTRQPGLIEDLVPNIMSVADIQRVLQNLLAENVSIANVDLICETLVDAGRHIKDTATLTETVRQRLKHAICQNLRGTHDDLAVLSLDPRIENQIMSGVSTNDGNNPVVIEPELAEHIIRTLSKMSDEMVKQGRHPVLLCGAELRRHMHNLTRRSVPKLAILSVNEIPLNINLTSYDVIKAEG
ncbi:flagellar biosynthesis protein FlhA [Sphingorhabdus sp. Alg239-R122]|uniref:flagellar biosynthesis protein FlhA n=1 Tax=Sphingorhabdus sp. Alg239-R122 TaxID=2305989 RepID=UPI0013DA0616|nr:flagellar biosynthesis protein FlhA [Sphingorhabdus sp. Alg239-R122]